MTQQAFAGTRGVALRQAMCALRVAASWHRLIASLPADLPALRGQCGALAEDAKRRALLRAVG